MARGFEDNMNYLPKSELVFLLRIEADHSCFLETLLPILTFLVRGQLISKGLFVFFNSSKNPKNFYPSRLGQKLKFSSSFFGRIGDTKICFEINWPLVFNVCKLSFYVWLMDHRLIYMCYENKSRDGRYVMTRSDDAFWCINWPIVINYHVHNGIKIFLKSLDLNSGRVPRRAS